MSSQWAIVGVMARRELAALFFTPTVWGALAIFCFLTGLITGIAVLQPGGVAELRTVAAAAGWAMLLVAPALSLRPATEERRSGFWEVLATSPASVSSVVGGRFIAGVIALLLLCVVGLGGPMLVLESLARPEHAQAACAALGVMLVGSLYLSSGQLFGSLTSSAAVAYLSTFFFWLVVLIGIRSIAPVVESSQADLLFALDPVRRLEGFLDGSLDSSNCAYFVCFSLAFLIAAAAVQSTQALRGAAGGVVEGVLAPIAASIGALLLLGGVAAWFHAPVLRTSVDTTRTRGWSLSDSDRKFVEGLTGGWTITWIAPSVDSSSSQRAQVAEVLDAVAASSSGGHVSVVRIDPITPSGGIAYSKWLASLVAQRRPDSQGAREAVMDGIAQLEALPPFASAQANALFAAAGQLPEGSPDRTHLEQAAGALAGLSGGAPMIAGSLRSMLEQRSDQALEDYSGAAAILASSHRDWSAQLGTLSSWLASRALDESAPQPLRTAASAARPEIVAQARKLLRNVDALDAVAPDQLQELSRVLARGGAVVVESPSGVAVVAEAGLVQGSDNAASVAFDRRFRVEQLVVGAMRSVTDSIRPRVILVHGEDRSMLAPSSDGVDASGIVDALKSARVEVSEWRTAVSPRPIASKDTVWFVIPPRQFAIEQESSERALLEAVSSLAAQGSAVFLNVGPSIRPLSGRIDPWAHIASLLGATATTQAVIVDDIPTGEGRTQRRTMLDPVSAAGDQPLSRALDGERVAFPVAVPVQISGQNAAISGWPILVAQPAPGRSIERDWRRRAPEADSIESISDPVGVAMALTRSMPGGASARAIVAGSPSWMFTATVDSTKSLGGSREALLAPGNREFAVNGVLWLAGLEGRIGDSGSGREVPRIGAISVRSRLQYTAELALAVPFGSIALGALVLVWRARK